MSGGDRRNADSELIVAIAGGSRIEDAASDAGVSESTVYRRLRDPAFKQKIADARAEMVSRVVDQLAEASSTAAATLVELLSHPTPPAVRLSAARSILELGAKLRESADLEARVAELEERFSQNRSQARRAMR